MALHLYGVVRAGAALPRRPGSPELSAVPYQDLAVVVGPIADDAEPTDADAVHHLDVLTGLVQLGPVLPLRFGTVAPDEQSAREEVLAPAADELRVQLDAVDGLAELRLELTFDEQSVLRAVVAEDPSLREQVEETGAELSSNIEFGERVVRRVQQWRTSATDEILRPVLQNVTSSVRLTETAPTVERVALLCELDHVEAVDAAVAELGDTAPAVSIEYVGPLPVFSFREQLANAQPRGSRWGW